MSEPVASHSESTPQEEAVSQAFEVFGLDAPAENNAPELSENEQESEQVETPAIEDDKPAKTIKVKVDKEEREFDISDDKLPEYVQKAYALDKVRNKQSELEKNLERAAKLNGFDKVEDYVSNLERMELDAQRRQQDQFQDLRQQLREEAEEAGLDPQRLDAWLDNHPLLQEANKAILTRQTEEQQRIAESQQAQARSKWAELYQAYPDLEESSSAFNDGGTPDWFTPDMQSRIERGYDPKDAYELAHRHTIMTQTKKQAEQKAIKEQRLGLRSQVEADAHGETEPEVPNELSSAFALFGLDPKSAKKYVKK